MDSKSLSPLLSGVILIAITISAAFITATTFSSVIQKQSQSKETHELSSCAVATLKLLSGTTSCSYSPLIDNSTVLYFSFDNDQDGYIEDLSGNGNTGYLYGNSRLILHFDEGSGNYVYDKTAYNNSGELKNNPTWITDENQCISGSCLKFDGIDDYINISDSSSLDITDEITITAWVKPFSNGGDWQTIITKAQRATLASLNFSYNLRLEPSGVVHCSVNTTTNGWVGVTSNTILINFTWYQLACVYDGNSVKLYINGNLEKSVSSSGNITPSSYPVMIGNDPDNSDQFNGTIDELAIYSRALTEEEIKVLYQAKRAKFIEFVNSKHGKGIEFDGVDDYVKISGIFTPFFETIHGPSTLIVTFSPSSTGKISYLFGDACPEWRLLISASDYIDGCAYQCVISSSKILPYTSYTAAVVHAHPTGLTNTKVKLFVNGVYQGETTFTVTQNGYINELRYLGVGKKAISSCSLDGYYFNGTIDEVLIYNRSLSENEIKRTHILSLLVQNPSSTTIPDLQISVKIKNKYTNQTEIYTNKTGISLNPGEIKLLQIRVPEGEIEKIIISSPCGVSIEYDPREVGRSLRCE